MDRLKHSDVAFLTARGRVEIPMGMLSELTIGMGTFETLTQAMVMSAATQYLWGVTVYTCNTL